MNDERDAYVAKVETQLEEWRLEIEQLQDRAAKARDDARAQLERAIEEVQKEYQEVRARLDGVRHARGETWHDLEDGMQRACAELRQSIDDASSRIG